MKKSDLKKLIIESIYEELPEIISEIKQSLRAELMTEIDSSKNGDSIRHHIREEFRKINPSQEKNGGYGSLPEGSRMKVNYGGESIASGKGVLEWFAGKQNVIRNEKKEHNHNETAIKSFMTERFGKQIK